MLYATHDNGLHDGLKRVSADCHSWLKLACHMCSVPRLLGHNHRSIHWTETKTSSFGSDVFHPGSQLWQGLPESRQSLDHRADARRV